MSSLKKKSKIGLGYIPFFNKNHSTSFLSTASSLFFMSQLTGASAQVNLTPILQDEVIISNSTVDVFDNPQDNVGAFNDRSYIVVWIENPGIGGFGAIYDFFGNREKLFNISNGDIRNIGITVMPNNSFIVNFFLPPITTIIKSYDRNASLISQTTRLGRFPRISFLSNSSFVMGYVDGVLEIFTDLFQFDSFEIIYTLLGADLLDVSTIQNNRFCITWCDLVSQQILGKIYFNNGTELNDAFVVDNGTNSVDDIYVTFLENPNYFVIGYKRGSSPYNYVVYDIDGTKIDQLTIDSTLSGEFLLGITRFFSSGFVTVYGRTLRKFVGQRLNFDSTNITVLGNEFNISEAENDNIIYSSIDSLSNNCFVTTFFRREEDPPENIVLRAAVYCGLLTLPPTISPLPTPPTLFPTTSPSMPPSMSPSTSPTKSPSKSPSISPSMSPSTSPTKSPSKSPSISPSMSPSTSPTKSPSKSPSISPSMSPSTSPAKSPSKSPTNSPSKSPSMSPSISPTKSPSKSPSMSPSRSPSNSPSKSPSMSPSTSPTKSPSNPPTKSPTMSPSQNPTVPTDQPTNLPTEVPTIGSTQSPTFSPTLRPTESNFSARGLAAILGLGFVIIICIYIMCFILIRNFSRSNYSRV